MYVAINRHRMESGEPAVLVCDSWRLDLLIAWLPRDASREVSRSQASQLVLVEHNTASSHPRRPYVRHVDVVE